MEKKIKTIVFLVDKDNKNILLGMKKVRFGAGKWNGFGGKVEPGETIEEGAARELVEESGVTVSPSELSKRAVITFYSPIYETTETHVYFASIWQGEPVETEEMRPQWFSFDTLPFDSMWPDDRHWLPRVLDGQKLNGEFYFDDKDKILEFTLTESKL